MSCSSGAASDGRAIASCQAELLKHEESRRRSMEMRAYLERQMHEKLHAKAAAKLEARHDELVRDGIAVTALPNEGKCVRPALG